MARCLILIADGFPEQEVFPMREALENEGHEVVLVGPSQGASVSGSAGAEVTAERDALHLNLNQAHVVIVPGGASADKVAETPSMVNIIYSVAHKGRLVATVGRGARALIPASAQKSPNPIETGNVLLPGGFLKGRRVTGDPAVREELEKAGARFSDRLVVADEPVVTARTLEGPARHRFLDALLPLLAKAERPVVARIL